MSRPSNSEKYLVCMGFKYSEKDAEYKKRIDMLHEILEESHKNKDLNLLDIFPDYEEIDKKLVDQMLIVNIQVESLFYHLI